MKLATLGFLKKNGKTLMLHRTKRKNDMNEGKWVGIGGKIIEGETPEEGIKREFKEETGLEIKMLRFKGVLTFPPDHGGSGDGGREGWYVFLFVVNDYSGELIECDEGELKWVDDNKLFDLNIWESDKEFMMQSGKEGFFSGKFSYQNGKFIGFSIEVY